MRKTAIPSDPPRGPILGSGGVIRGRIGPSATLADVFAVLDQDSSNLPVMRHPVRNLRGARIALDPADGSGYYDLTRIGPDVFEDHPAVEAGDQIGARVAVRVSGRAFTAHELGGRRLLRTRGFTSEYPIWRVFEVRRCTRT